MKLRFTPRAIEDLAAIANYLREHNRTAARRIRAAILETLETLLVFPHAGRRQSVEGVYKFATRKYHYLVYYTIDVSTDELIVLSIQHPSQARQHSDK